MEEKPNITDMIHMIDILGLTKCILPKVGFCRSRTWHRAQRHMIYLGEINMRSLMTEYKERKRAGKGAAWYEISYLKSTFWRSGMWTVGTTCLFHLKEKEPLFVAPDNPLIFPRYPAVYFF